MRPGLPGALAVRDEIHRRRGVPEVAVLEVSHQTHDLDVERWCSPGHPLADGITPEAELPGKLFVDDGDPGRVLRIGSG